MRLEGGELLVLKTLRDLQGDSNDYVEDARLTAATAMVVGDVRDWLETLEGKGFVERVRATQGFSAYITAKGKQALRVTEPISSTKPAGDGAKSWNLGPQPPPQPGSTPPGDFDPRIEDVKREIRTKLNRIKNNKVLDKYDNEVGILDLVSAELGCDRPQPGGDLSEQIPDFLTARCAEDDLMSLVRVFKRLLGQRKDGQARPVAEIVDRMLPLCLPQRILGEAWRQLQEHGAVVIQNVVARKAGAELVVAGLYHEPAKFRKPSPEPAGEQLIPFEEVPIGHPERNMEPALRGLFLATHHADATEEQGKGIVNRLTVEQMREDLRGHYKARRLEENRPCYCAVELAATQEGGKNQLSLLSELGGSFLSEKGEPGLLFVALAPDSKTRAFEAFVITCLNTRFKSEEKGKPA